MWYPMHVSVKDRGVCTLFIGPVSLVAYRQQRVDLPPLFSMTDLEKKLGMNPRIGQPVCYGLCRESFSREQ
jgi:hypothetical protein